MTQEELLQTLAELGWTRYRDEIGTGVVTRRVGTGVVSAVPQLRRLLQQGRSSHRLSIRPGLSADALDVASTVIASPRARFVDEAVVHQASLDEKFDRLTRGDVERLSAQIVAWAAAQDLEAGLAGLRALPTDCIGIMPRWHLAALAAAGKVERLIYYRDSFAAGERLGFIPGVSDEWIERARRFAERRRADPTWLPRTPRRRV